MLDKKTLFEKLSTKRERDAKVLLDWEYRGIWETAIKKYSDTAHFIFELLQNADDTKASWVEFELEENGLWFKHNGSVRFTISDVDNAQEDTLNGKLGHINAITAIGNSNKIDEQKIGKFGIGFKAVFAYSLTPHIYDDNFSFRLENYIVPVEISPEVKKRKQGETLFFFPFNHKTKGKLEAYNEIEDKIVSLFHPVLFLSHLKIIKWQVGNKNGYYSKEVERTFRHDEIEASLIKVVNTANQEIPKNNIWIFSKEIHNTELNSVNKISVGFFLTKNGKLETGKDYSAFCFFPTKEATNLRFLIQAPFLLNDSREGIKAGEPWNNQLIKELADLSSESLLMLKDIGINEGKLKIEDNILDLVPFNPDVFTDLNNKSKISFKPFYSTILHTFKNQVIIPGSNGKYYSTDFSYWATDPELADLFTDEQVSQLMNNPGSGWVFPTKGQKQVSNTNPELEEYIDEFVNETLDPKKLLRRITVKFIEGQSDEWLLKFYTYLGGRKFLWDDREKLALKRPILLNQDRKAVIPFDEELSTSNIFLPTDRATSYDTIYSPFIKNNDALEFFKSLGIGTPDLKAEIYISILPQYLKEDFEYDTESLLQHFDLFITYYQICPQSNLNEYISKLKEIYFIAANVIIEPETIYCCKPETVYFNNDKLKKYFNNHEDIYFLDENFYVKYIQSEKKEIFFKFLKELGLADTPRIILEDLDVTIENKEWFGLDEIEISKKYTKQTITDKEIHGLKEAIISIDLELSVTIWEYLLNILKTNPFESAEAIFEGVFRYYPKGYSTPKSRIFESTVSQMLRNDLWLFDKEGRECRSNEVSKETIHESYNLNDYYTDKLIEYLGLETPDVDLNLSPDQMQAFKLGKMLMDKGATQTDIDDFLRTIVGRKIIKTNNGDINSDEIPINEDDIDETFSKLKRGVKSKFNTEQQSEKKEEDLFLEEASEQAVDQDEYIKPSVDLQKKIDKLKEQTEAQIEDLTRIEKLNEIITTSETYSFAWFKALLELESLSSTEATSQGKQISIQFSKVEKEHETERTLILKHPNRYIPQSIEDIGDLQIKLFYGNETKSVTVEVVSVKEYTLRAKLKKSVDISGINLEKVTKVILDIKNPVFILEELRKAFYQLNFEDDKNLQKSLTENIRFIFGPPGTGKTTYLASNEIIPLMQKEENLKVLVLAPTNKAADVLTKRIIEKMEDDDTYHNWLLRFGTTADAELESTSLVVDKNFDIRTKPRNTTITTIARFAYDYFQPDIHDERLHLKFLHWDYIIIDEASMVTLAGITYALYQRPEAKFIVAGDPFQIQPITQIDHWKDMNIYSMVQLDKFVNPVTVPHQFEIVNLKKQFRSIPTIGNVFSHFTYNGILEHHRSLDDQKALTIKGLNFKDINIIKFPVSKYESIYKPSTLNKSNYQVYSALFTVEFVNNLVKQIDQSSKVKFRIGIICPYKAQATLIDRLLSQQHNNSNNTEILVGTIHGFQGDECDIIISVFNPPFSISKSQLMFLNKQNILNVSISRARDYLFVIMPDNNTQDFENLYRIRKIESLIHIHAKNRLSIYDSSEIETIMFGKESYIYDNSFATSHQSVNVYSVPEKKYEIRCEETAIDVQLRVNAEVALKSAVIDVAENIM